MSAIMNKRKDAKLYNNAQANAIKNCKRKFKGLNETERLNLANAFIKHTTSKGGSVQGALNFLQQAEVMSDTELMHATTF